jgi:hypothetical protein
VKKDARKAAHSEKAKQQTEQIDNLVDQVTAHQIAMLQNPTDEQKKGALGYHKYIGC